ncbi:MAG TPA: ABC transporter ATP-binding protein [Candidatus Sulfopaludibacter sp.]|jgi:ABC-2 type transport system ATP-binding protein|nr:ABC transporter ATP-binding protein [Candidatus Sulfopaludibacter sp.]
MNPTTDAIRVINLVKKYGQTLAVENLSLNVRAGTMFGFLGPNGSGKSTTIGCLTGLLDPTAGSVEILGQPFSAENAELKRRMGVMPESLGLFDPLYAHEFLAFVGRMFGLDEAVTRRRVSELLEALELTDTSKSLSEYSTGMRKRVAFAAAVIHTPDVLFLDEPFESIDPAGVALMKQWLRRFTEQGRTVFITSHVLETVERLCTEVAIVTKPGKLVWQGDITVLSREGAIEYQGKEFRALEPLFLHLTGERYADLNWL